MAKAICSECGSPVEIAEGEEWEYCPMCENDQVELKRKSVIDKLMEHSEEIVIRTEKDSKYGTVIVRTVTPVIRLNKAMELFKELEQKLEITEKALELACDTAQFEDTCDYCAYKGELEITNDCPRWCETDEKFFATQAMGYFKAKAKEMMKGE